MLAGGGAAAAILVERKVGEHPGGAAPTITPVHRDTGHHGGQAMSARELFRRLLRVLLLAASLAPAGYGQFQLFVVNGSASSRRRPSTI